MHKEHNGIRLNLIVTACTISKNDTQQGNINHLKADMNDNDSGVTKNEGYTFPLSHVTELWTYSGKM